MKPLDNQTIIIADAGEDNEATSLGQVNTLIAAIPSAPSPVYGGVVSPSGSSSVSVTEGVWTALPGTFIAAPSQNIVGAADSTITINGSSRDMILTCAVVLAHNQSSANILLALFRNGSQYSYMSADVLTEQTTTSGIKAQLLLPYIIPASDISPGVVFDIRMTLTGASGTMTRYQTQFFMTTAN